MVWSKEKQYEYQKRYVETHREQVNTYARKYYKEHPGIFQKRIRERTLKNKQEAVKKYLVGELIEHQESVLALLTDTRVNNIKTRDIRHAVFGGLLYILVDRRAMPHRIARNTLPKEARSPGQRPYISTLRAYKKIKKAMKE